MTSLNPTTEAEISKHCNHNTKKEAADDEGGLAMFGERKPNNVHTIKAGNDGEWQHHDRKKSKNFDDVVGVVRDD